MTFSSDEYPFTANDPLLGVKQLNFDRQRTALGFNDELARDSPIQTFKVGPPSAESLAAHRALYAEMSAETEITDSRFKQVADAVLPWVITIGLTVGAVAWVTSQSGPRPELEPVPALDIGQG